MFLDLLLTDAIVCSSQGQTQMDVGVCKGKIVALGDLSGWPTKKRLDLNGLHLLPGIIDTQVHFREPGMEHKEDLESGSRAAIAGGVTSFFEMPNTNPNTTTPAALQDKLQRCVGRAWADHGFFIGASNENADVLGDYELLPGSPGIKIFMGSSTGSLLVEDDETLERVLRNGTHRVSVHSEDEPRLRSRKQMFADAHDPSFHPQIRDAEAARLSTERLLRLSEETGRPVHVLHISTEDELSLLLHAKQRGLGTTCEVTPQHLSLFAPDCYERLGTLAQMNPPIRSDAHRSALWMAVKNGLFDVFGSDHAPHTLEEKSKTYPDSPSGMPGVQTMVPILLEWVRRKELKLERFVAMACENPTKLFGIANKGFIREGYDADFVAVDLSTPTTIREDWLQSKCGWSPFTGVEVTGIPIHVVLRGHIMVEDGKLVGEPVGRPVEYTWK